MRWVRPFGFALGTLGVLATIGTFAGEVGGGGEGGWGGWPGPAGRLTPVLMMYVMVCGDRRTKCDKDYDQR